MSADWLQQVQDHTMHLELYYSKTTDWCIEIWKRGCGEGGTDIKILCEQSPDLSLVLASGEVAIKNWLLENNGGY